MQSVRTLITAALCILLCSCSKARPSESTLIKAPAIDLGRLQGEWHVPARIPTIIDRDATDMSVEFKPSGPRSMLLAWNFSNGAAPKKESSWNLRLALNSPGDSTSWDISFFWPVSFRYQVIEYSGDYSWLVIGSVDRKYMWILSRSKEMPSELLNGLLARLKSSEFDTAAIVRQQTKSLN